MKIATLEKIHISIHALLAESDLCSLELLADTAEFLSTLSLRRATRTATATAGRKEFLSTLSLRRATARQRGQVGVVEISIHALLAESDRLGLLGWLRTLISIHALLAESDRRGAVSVILII